MKIAGIIKNDVVNGYDVCVSLWMQGCPFHCDNCHNPSTWAFDQGIEVDEQELYREVCSALIENGVQRNLSILGGEPLCPENLPYVGRLLDIVRKSYPDILIFLWTGYKFEDLNTAQRVVIKKADILIDGRYEDKNRVLILPLIGSTNQRIIDIRASLAEKKLLKKVYNITHLRIDKISNL